MAKKAEPVTVTRRPKFEIEAVQYVKLTIPEGGEISYSGATRYDAVHEFTQDEAFALSNAVREAAQRL